MNKPTMKRWTGPCRGYVFPPGFIERMTVALRYHFEQPEIVDKAKDRKMQHVASIYRRTEPVNPSVLLQPHTLPPTVADGNIPRPRSR